MEKILNWYTFLAFVLGVLASTAVKRIVAQAKGKLGG